MASSETSILTPIHRLAEHLKQDILSRGLSFGDRYLTAAEAARQFGVSTATANRAMRVLAEREVLSRERSRGTFVGRAVGEPRRHKVRTIMIFMRAEDRSDVGPASSALMESVRQSLGDVNLHFAFIPDEDAVSYTQSVLDPLLPGGHVAGMIAVSCDREVYCHLAGLKLPLVILGSLYPEEKVIPSVDADNKQAGRLLAKYLVDHDHRHMVLLTGNESLPGEHDFHDGVCEVIAEMRLPATAILARSLPGSDAAITALLRHMFQSTQPPTAFICRGGETLLRIVNLMESLGPTGQPKPEIVCDGYIAADKIPFPYTHVSPRASLREVTDLITGMLKDGFDEKIDAPSRIVIPVELHKAR